MVHQVKPPTAKSNTLISTPLLTEWKERDSFHPLTSTCVYCGIFMPPPLSYLRPLTQIKERQLLVWPRSKFRGGESGCVEKLSGLFSVPQKLGSQVCLPPQVKAGVPKGALAVRHGPCS